MKRITGRNATVAACALMLLVVIGIRYAEPILDGDLFFHMAYARQMLDRHTLTLDHTAFSWTPTSNRMIYCNWLSELILYGLWQHAGIASLFALRYLCVLGVTLLAWHFARRLGLGSAPVTALILLILVLGVCAGTIVKPELFSLVSFHLLLWSYFRWKLDGRVRWLYVMPVIVLMWVNSHGGFVLVAPLLVAIVVGEALNRRFNRHIAIAAAACGVVTMLNPYGWRYPWQLFEDLVLQKTPRPDKWNDAMQNIFSRGAGSYYVELLIVMGGILILLSIRTRRVDWSIVLMNLGYIGLFMAYLRSTGFWPGVLTYSSLYLMAAEPRKQFLRLRSYPAAAALVLFAAMAGQSIVNTLIDPSFGSWTGFGISYVNPVPEAEFVRSLPFSGRLYNLFDSGGYLLWRLYPKYRVMTDSRSFPYLSWFADQYEFAMGRNVDDFLQKYPADVAVIELLHGTLWGHFLELPQWRPVYYGPSAAIFVKRDTGFEAPLTAAPMDQIRNAEAALRVFSFARAVGDFRTAWKMLDRVETHLAWQTCAEDLEAARAYREEQRALQSRDWRRAKALFDVAFKRSYLNDRDRLVGVFLSAIEKAQQQGKSIEATAFPAAIQKLIAPEPGR